MRWLWVLVTLSFSLLPSTNSAQPRPSPRPAVEEMTLCGQMTYGPEGYTSRPLRPRVTVRLVRGEAGRVRVELSHLGYRCDLNGVARGNNVELATSPPCAVAALQSPDFCVLPAERCQGVPAPSTCEAEASRLGVGTLTMVEGTLTRSGGRLTLQGTLHVDACLLVRGRNDNRPIRVEQAPVRFSPCP